MHLSSSLRFQRHGGFTLIELVTTLALVLVLAALLFPAIQAGRSKAAAMGCLNNLRILALAHISYRNDHNGAAPAYVIKSTDPEGNLEGRLHNYWGLYLLRYYYIKDSYAIFDEKNQFIEVATERCPASRLTGQTVYLSQGKAPEYDICKLDGQPNINLNARCPWSQTPLLWDGWTPMGKLQTGSAPLRHSNGVNMAFMDGHVEYVTAKDGRLYSGYILPIYQTGVANSSQEFTGNFLGTTSKTPPY